MRKVITLIGTRPELIKMSRVINELDKTFNHILVHSEQNYDYELNQIFFDDLEIRKPDYFLGASKDSPIASISDVLIKLDDVLEKEKPDAFLYYGDTNTGIAIIAAKKRKIPIFHMEAGNRCFDQRVPEELNRKVIDHLSDINMVLSENARKYLLSENINPERVFKTGSHMYEVLNYYKSKIDKSKILKQLNIKKNKYFIVSAHREENVDDIRNLTDLLNSLNSLADEYKFPIIFSTHPRTRNNLKRIKNIKMRKLIQFPKPFSFTDYIQLQKSSLCVLSDSGTLTEESSILKFPAIMIRQTHERPEGMDAGILIMSGLKKNNIINAVKIMISKGNKKHISNYLINDYKNKFVSKQIIKIIHSYIDYVNTYIWHK